MASLKQTCKLFKKKEKAEQRIKNRIEVLKQQLTEIEKVPLDGNIFEEFGLYDMYSKIGALVYLNSLYANAEEKAEIVNTFEELGKNYLGLTYESTE